jgi:N-methylhydantoinase B/oxoprolinase/acetone carboxylase alpha subunit
MNFEDEMEKIRQGARNFIKTEINNNQFSASWDFGGTTTMRVELCNRPS